ncbi:MAG: AAA family ATPase [Synechococcus sp.]
MKFPFFQGQGVQQPKKVLAELSPSRRHTQDLHPSKYRPDEGLVAACNVALLLGQPLLLTGEAGTGKTLFADCLAWELGLGQPLKFETKSTSTAKELFYTFDTLKRFQDAQAGDETGNPLDYLTYQALGLAILQTRLPNEIANFLPEGFSDYEPRRSVVLVDEVDKAPRDFPNDILNELERLYFRIPELKTARSAADRGIPTIAADPELRPIVIFTSNSERDLPDAFLRRCAFYNIPFPDRDRLLDIVAARLGLSTADNEVFLTQALDLFERLREDRSGLAKKPATAELLGWLISLQDLSEGAENPLSEAEVVESGLSSLIKTASDREKALKIVKRWLEETK